MENKPSPNPSIVGQIPLDTNWLLGTCNHLSEIVKGSGITNIDINELLISKYYGEAQQLLSNFISLAVTKQKKYNFKISKGPSTDCRVASCQIPFFKNEGVFISEAIKNDEC